MTTITTPSASSHAAGRRAIPKTPVAPYVPYARRIDPVELAARTQEQLAEDAGVRTREAEGRTAAERVVLAALRETLEIADRLGVKRALVAHRLGVQLGTLESWVLPGRDARIPGYRLVELLTKGPILPLEARMALWRRIADAGGVTVVVKPSSALGTGAGDVGQETLEAMQAAGSLAGEVAPCLAETGEGGASITERERARMMERLSVAEQELADVRAAIEAAPTTRGGKPLDVRA